MDFAELVMRRLKELDENVNSFEAKMGWRQGFLRAFVRDDGKRSQPTLEKAKVILEALGQQLYVGPPIDLAPPPSVEVGERGSEFVAVPLHNANLAAGMGAGNEQETTVARLAFRRDWLTGLGVAPSAARLARVLGDSMLPTLQPDDMVLIDTNRHHPPAKPRRPNDGRPSPIFALRHDDGAVVKRLERISDDSLMLLSDNPAYPPQMRTISELTKIIGKVVWWGHTVRD